MRDVLIGIDAGTSAVKVCAFGRDGALLAKAHRGVPVMTPYPLWAEIDLDLYWELVAEALREVVPKVGSIAAIGLSTTCPTTVALDANDAPVRPGIIYMDGRADEILRETLGSDATAYLDRAGNRASTSTVWAANLRWLSRHEPETLARVARVVTLNGYLALRLTGKTGIDPTQAAYSGLVDVREPEARWNPALLALWGVDPALLPAIVASTTAVGSITAFASAETGLESGIPVALGAADTAAAAYAVGIREDADVFESVGTSGVITFCLDRPAFDAAFLNRYHVLPGRWLAHGAMSTLGGAFGWLNSKVWPELRSLPEIERLAQESVPGANGLVFLPYLSGERSPIWDAQASGAWIGLRLHHTRQDMIRAVFEGTAFGLRQILDRAEAAWGSRPAQLTGVGGGARSLFGAQLKADILRTDYVMTDMADASSLGAAMIGGVGAGLFADAFCPKLPRVKATSAPVRPGPAARLDIYDRRFRVYAELYPQLSGVMHELA